MEVRRTRQPGHARLRKKLTVFDSATEISGAMSVNEILQRYPSTGELIEQLHINRLREGYESVDELAWRHGMDVAHFLEQLRDVAAKFPRY